MAMKSALKNRMATMATGVASQPTVLSRKQTMELHPFVHIMRLDLIASITIIVKIYPEEFCEASPLSARSNSLCIVRHWPTVGRLHGHRVAWLMYQQWVEVSDTLEEGKRLSQWAANGSTTAFAALHGSWLLVAQLLEVDIAGCVIILVRSRMAKPLVASLWLDKTTAA